VATDTTREMYQRVRETLVYPPFAIVAVYVSNPYTNVVPAAVLLGGGVGALWYYRERTAGRRRLATRPRIAPSIRAGTLAVYLALFGATTLLYVIEGFPRPMPVQALLVALYAVTIGSLLVFESPRSALALVLATGVYHRALVYYASAIQIGNDALFHTRVATEILATGSLQPLAASKYWYAPLYHVVVSFTAGGLGVTVRDAAFLTVTVTATVVPPLAIYYFLRRDWSAEVGVLGAFCYLVADSVVLNTVHATPTSLGIAGVALALPYADRYLTGGRRTDLAVYGLAIVAILLTHQLSLFAALVTLGTFLAASAVWRGALSRRELVLGGLLTVAFVAQSLYTQYSGPTGEEGSFLGTVAPSILSSIATGLTGAGRTAGYPPAAAEVAVSGADALTAAQVLGLGGLFALAVLGTLVWLSRHTGPALRRLVALGTVVVGTSLLVFGPPALGVNVFIPGRWFPFLYVFLALLAAPGVAVLVATVPDVGPRPITALLVLLAVLVPYTALMTTNAYGAVDNPVLDDAPAATRLTTTPTEAAGYEFVDEHAGETRVVAGFGTWRTIERYYGQETLVYRTEYGASTTVYDGDQLLVYREYSATDHASYFLRYEGQEFRVYGPLPGPQRYDSQVYSNGDVRVYFHADGDSESETGS
jgi:hypothetical protein